MSDTEQNNINDDIVVDQQVAKVEETELAPAWSPDEIKEAESKVLQEMESIQSVIRDAEKRLEEMQQRFISMEKDTEELTKKLEEYSFSDGKSLKDIQNELDDMNEKDLEEYSNEDLDKMLTDAKKFLDQKEIKADGKEVYNQDSLGKDFDLSQFDDDGGDFDPEGRRLAWEETEDERDQRLSKLSEQGVEN